MKEFARSAMDDPAQLYERALRAYRNGEHQASEALLDTALQIAPDDARVLLLKGVAHTKDDAPLCLSLIERSVHLDPLDPQAWYNLAVVEAERGLLTKALAAYRRAVSLSPLFLDALNNGAELLRRFDRFEEALEWVDRHLRLGAANWAAHLNRAIALSHLRRFEEADAAFGAAAALAPDRPIVAWEMFSPLLHRRRFAEAWDCFERRFAVGHLNGVFHYPFPQPPWRGESLSGKSILIHNEQGLGDQIMFASALPEVIAEAAAVTLVCAPELTPLFHAAFPGVRVFPARYGRVAGDHPPPEWLGQLGAIDYQVPIGGLMALRRRSLSDFACTTFPYLRPSETVQRRWTGWATHAMPRGAGARVGLCWASNPALFRHDSSRRAVKKSMRLQDMAPLGRVAGVQFVSVLNWPLEALPAGLQGRVADVSADLKSLEDTAALLTELDLVITVDTAVAHLAGALGRPVWLLLHDYPDCRWELEGGRSYWYPSMRLFRQSRPGDWTGVLADVANALRGGGCAP